MTWRIERGLDERAEEAITDGLVEHNQQASAAIRRRFEPENLPSFQAPDFYARCGYETYGVEVDYPPGHTNHLMRKDL